MWIVSQMCWHRLFVWRLIFFSSNAKKSDAKIDNSTKILFILALFGNMSENVACTFPDRWRLSVIQKWTKTYNLSGLRNRKKNWGEIGYFLRHKKNWQHQKKSTTRRKKSLKNSEITGKKRGKQREKNWKTERRETGGITEKWGNV